MTPERWQQVDKIFQAAVETDSDKRAAFLDNSCAGDEELRREVESLIASDGQGLSFIDAPAFQVAAGLLVRDQPELTEGQRIGHYEIAGLIGTGGMGEVYLAKDERLNRRIALKLLPADYTTDKDRLRRFQQEAQAASALNHPNILTIHEVGEVDGQHFIVTEFVEGETLRQRLRRSRLDLSETVDIAIQVTGALSTAHQAGIVHRDIKPENIMLRPDGYVKVLDFGVAKLTERHEQTPKLEGAVELDTSSGLVMGTVRYMSPEQTRGFLVDPRSDIFSLGVVLYEMVAGHVPFKGEAAGDLIKSILKDEPPPLTEYLPDAPEDLQRIVSKALRKDKSKRYQTMEDLLVDLKTLRHQVGFGSGFQTSAVLGFGSMQTARRARPQTTGPGTANGQAISNEDLEVGTASSIEYVVSQIRQHKTRAALGLLALVIVVGSVTYPLKRFVGKRAAPFERMNVTMLTSTGNTSDAAISPDGRYVAYVVTDAGQSSVWLKQLLTASNVQILPPVPDAGEYHGLTFAPDGNYLYYLLFENHPATLYRIPTSGGTPEKLLEKITNRVSFSPDGKRFAFIRLDSSEGINVLMIANADGSEERIIATRRGPDYYKSWAGTSWSPDGKLIACVGFSASDGYERVIGADVETGAEKPLTFRKWNSIGVVVWLSDMSGFLLTANEEASSPLPIWHIAYPGGEARKITNDPNRYGILSLTADSGTLVATQSNNASSIWVAPEGDADRARQIAPGKREGFRGISWTPDDRIVYASEASGNPDIWVMNADGTDRKQLTTDPHMDTEPSVSPDGRYIVFTSNRTGHHIWRMDIDGGNLMQLTTGRSEDEPYCSPDSKWVVYNAQESGKTTIWKVPMEGGDAVQLTDTESVRPIISPDGKSILYFAGDTQMWFKRGVIPFEGGKPIKVFDVPWTGWPMYPHRWTPDGRGLAFIDTRNGIGNIWIQPIDGNPPWELTNFNSKQAAASDQIAEFDWSRDGKWLAYARFELKSDIMMISHFR